MGWLPCIATASSYPTVAVDTRLRISTHYAGWLITESCSASTHRHPQHASTLPERPPRIIAMSRVFLAPGQHGPNPAGCVSDDAALRALTWHCRRLSRLLLSPRLLKREEPPVQRAQATALRDFQICCSDGGRRSGREIAQTSLENVGVFRDRASTTDNSASRS